MSLKEYWAYDFACDQQLEGILAVFNDQRYSGLLQIEPGSVAEKGEVDRVFRDLLAKVKARSIVEIEPYD